MARCAPALIVVLAALALAGCGGSSPTRSSPSSTSSQSTSGTVSASNTVTASETPGELSYEGIPLEEGPQIAAASTTQTGKVDGVSCAPVEQLAYHIHAHLSVFSNGVLYSLPGGIGIPGSSMAQTNQGPVAAGGQCYYWLHTHTSDGVIHIESPTKRIYTLGDFFDEWHQPLTPDQVGNLHGKITAFLNHKPWRASPRAIPLLPHAVIQLDIGQPIPGLVSVNWSGTGL
jgi:hypothetical protein